MNKENLESYISKRDEIIELYHKINTLGKGDGMIDNDVILNYQSGYPVPQAVVGYDWKKFYDMKKMYEKRISKLKEECDSMEQYIESIEDSFMRRIMRMRYLDGKTQKEIGQAVHMDRSTVSKKIDDFFKLSHKSHK